MHRISAIALSIARRYGNRSDRRPSTNFFNGSKPWRTRANGAA